MEGQLLCPRLGWGLEAGLEGETEHGDFFAQVLLWCGLWYGTCLAYPRLPQVEHPGLRLLQEGIGLFLQVTPRGLTCGLDHLSFILLLFLF